MRFSLAALLAGAWNVASSPLLSRTPALQMKLVRSTHILRFSPIALPHTQLKHPNALQMKLVLLSVLCLLGQAVGDPADEEARATSFLDLLDERGEHGPPDGRSLSYTSYRSFGSYRSFSSGSSYRPFGSYSGSSYSYRPMRSYFYTSYNSDPVRIEELVLAIYWG